MFKKVDNHVWAFDVEWVPDPNAGRVLYKLSQNMSDREVIQEMWKQGGASDDNPQPYIKTILCRVVSVAAVVRRIKPDGEITLILISQPRDVDSIEDCEESAILEKFLGAIGKSKPQLVGFNSHSSDITILIQRAIVNGISAPDFCRRPEKPWEGVDYFAKSGDNHIDLKDIVSSWGQGTPSLHELATLSAIPGKMGVNGQDVAEMWLDGNIKSIIAYNECDALTTYLVWLRIAHFAGFFDALAYHEEKERVVCLIHSLTSKSEHDHLIAYLNEWNRLQE